MKKMIKENDLLQLEQTQHQSWFKTVKNLNEAPYASISLSICCFHRDGRSVHNTRGDSLTESENAV